MNYISEINGFERWLETHSLPPASQLLYYKLLYWCSRAGWQEWTQVDNRRLMVSMQIAREASLNEHRERLVNVGLVEYQKGRKGQPGKYRLTSLSKNTSDCTYNLNVQSVVYPEVQSVVYPEAINKDKNKKKNNIKSNSDELPESPRKNVTALKFTCDCFEMQCVDKLISAVKEQLPNAKTPEKVSDKEKWALEIEKMKRIDKRTESEITEALDFAIKDQFWRTNIRSTAKLREKFETLILQSRNPRRNGTAANTQNKNRFHNFEQHNFDYEDMMWDMMWDMMQQ